MGYGHLRAAVSLADLLGVPVQRMEEPPLGDARDAKFWGRTREFYEALTRFSQLPAVSAPLGAVVQALTAIPPPWPRRDRSGPSAGTRWMEKAARSGAGAQLARHLNETGAPLLATFYAAAILAELHGARNLYCVVTDSDVNRVWAPPRPGKSAIRYFAPTEHARRRLLSYGVLESNVRTTGFPPDHLVGRAGIAARLPCRAPRPARSARAPPGAGHRGSGSASRGHAPAARRLRRRRRRRADPLGGPARPRRRRRGETRAPAARPRRGTAREGRPRPPRGAPRRRTRGTPGRRRALRPRHLRVPAKVPRPSRRGGRALEQAERAHLLRRPGASLRLRAAGRRPRGAQPSLGGRAGRAAPAARSRHRGRVAARMDRGGTLARAAWSGYLHLPALGLYEIADALE